MGSEVLRVQKLSFIFWLAFTLFSHLGEAQDQPARRPEAASHSQSARSAPQGPQGLWPFISPILF